MLTRRTTTTSQSRHQPSPRVCLPTVAQPKNVSVELKLFLKILELSLARKKTSFGYGTGTAEWI